MRRCLTILIGTADTTAAIVTRTGDGWTVERRAVKELDAASASPQLLANVIGELVQGFDAPAKLPVAAALSARWFSWRRLAEPQVPRRYRRAALTATFEEVSGRPVDDLHLVMESQVCGQEALVLATDAPWLEQLLEQLARFGLRPDLLVPDVTLVGDVARAASSDQQESPPSLMLSAGRDNTHVVALDHWQTMGWQEYADVGSARADLSRWRMDGGLAETVTVPQFEPTDDQMLVCLADRLDAGGQQENACSGRFSSGRRTRRLFAHAATALILLAAVLTAVAVPMLQRASTARHSVARVQEVQREAWQELMPGQPAPPSLLVRLQSEVARLKGLVGESTDAPSYRSARATIERVLANLPLGTRLDVSEIRLDQNDLTIRAETGSHADAERVARAIDALPGLECPLPRSDVLSPGRVVFLLHASLVDNDKEAPRGQ